MNDISKYPLHDFWVTGSTMWLLFLLLSTV